MVEPSAAPAQVRVHVRLFASYREAAGVARLDQGVPIGARVRDLVGAFQSQFPRLNVAAGKGLIAVNQEYVGEDFLLRDGDEVAFIPPVSGGR